MIEKDKVTEMYIKPAQNGWTLRLITTRTMETYVFTAVTTLNAWLNEEFKDESANAS